MEGGKFAWLKPFLSELAGPLVLSVIVGAPAAWWDWLFHGQPLGVPENKEIAFAIMVGSAVFCLTYVVKLAYHRSQELVKASTAGEKVVYDFQILSPLSELIRDAINNQTHFEPFLFQEFDHIRSSGGGYLLLQVGNGIYLRTLESALDHAKRSFGAVLTDEYYPSWFFKPDIGSAGKEVFSAKEKQEYLRIVNNHGIQLNAIRIMIFDDNALKKDFESMTPHQLIGFFQLHSKVRLYQVDPDVLSTLSGYSDIREVIKEDYGIIDEFLILKKNKRADQLNLFISSHNRTYGKVFEESFFDVNRNRFKNMKQIATEFIDRSRFRSTQKAKLSLMLKRARL